MKSRTKAPKASAKKKPAARKRAERAPAPWAPAEQEETLTRPASPFPIVGIGASAGGLEALEAFFKNVRADSGMAYVVVQHLDPTHKGMIIELLQRVSVIPVARITDGMQVAPNRVYVIPPNSDLSLLHGVFHLLAPTAPRGHTLPIDFFFRSLAADQQESSIGVILSGMGSDGTSGLHAIRERAGACFVQTLASAKFDGMPRSAIEAKVADVIALPEELPERIASYRRHLPDIPVAKAAIEDKAQSALQKVFLLLRAQTGNDFSLYKKSTIYRRIARRMGLHQIDTITDYVRYMRENSGEVELLFGELLIGVTSFFRDPLAWEQMAGEVMPALLAAREDGVLRAWVPACSTGAEAYSLAIVFRETLARLAPGRNITLQIFATDLDREAIESARQGVFPTNIAADVSPERLRRFFVEDDRGYRVNKTIREMVVFAPQNLVMDPPFTKLDILCCRNLLIYLAPELQRKVIPLFHYSLVSDGILFLGSAETVGTQTNLFELVDAKSRIYRRRESAVSAMPLDLPRTLSPAQSAGPASETLYAAKPVANLQALADRVFVQRFSPIGILCNDKGDILYTSGRTGKYLELPAGKANWNIMAMARDGLRYELSAAFASVARTGRKVVARGLRVTLAEGLEIVDVTIERLSEPEPLRGAIIIVVAESSEPKSAPEPAKPKRISRDLRALELEKELLQEREETQVIREEMQTSQEELRSTNEELQSTNEELQSTNEELTTSKEEMQSMNEELQTVNHELQAKVDELSWSNNDMKNLLNSTAIATLFLDGEMLVRRFTTQTAKLIKLIPGDAGRPITDITSNLDYPTLEADSREVLRTLLPHEQMVSARDGQWFTVRILPYRTLDNVIDGVVITFTDATAAKQVEQALLEQTKQLAQMTDTLPNLIWSFSPAGLCDYVNRRWVEQTGIEESAQLGEGWLELVHPDDREPLRSTLLRALKRGAEFAAEFRLRDREGAYRWFRSRTLPIRDDLGRIVKWYGSSTDIDDLKTAAEANVRARS